jgi:hypothetical protein
MPCRESTCTRPLGCASVPARHHKWAVAATQKVRGVLARCAAARLDIVGGAAAQEGGGRLVVCTSLVGVGWAGVGGRRCTVVARHASALLHVARALPEATDAWGMC